jgi:hypothetical protein
MSEQRFSPIEVLSSVDHGDDMQMRVRYQSTYAAWVALGLLLEETGIHEIYCEQHEDVLIRRANGKFHGCQVKTRLARLGSFKADDEQISNSISRFIALDREFPNSFERFIIATNVDFWDSAPNSKNLRYLISIGKHLVASITPTPKINRETRKFISGFAEEHKCKRDAVWSVISRIKLHPELPQFQDVEKQLAISIAEILNETYRTLAELTAAAKALVKLVADASSLGNMRTISRYFVFMEEPQDQAQAAIIQGKRICKDQVLKTINECFNAAVLLASGNHIAITDLPPGVSVLETKAAAGGLSVYEIDHLKSMKYSTEVLLQKWLYKYDEHNANARYDHLRLLVTEDVFEAAAHTKKDAALYGPSMLARLRANLKASFTQQSQTLSNMGVSYNHLLGIAGILTEDCTAWWSDQFDLKGNNSHVDE